METNEPIESHEAIEGGIDENNAGVSQGEVSSQIVNYEQDPRFESEWQKDVNKMYSSFSEIEKRVPVLEQELTQYKTRTPELETQLAQLNEQVGKYDKAQQLLQFFESNPKYQQALLGELEKIKLEESRMKYGDLPPEAIARLEQAEAVEARLKEIERNTQINQQVEVIRDQYTQVDSIANKYNIDYDKKEFHEYCAKNNVPPQMISAVFSKFAMQAVAEKSHRTGSVEAAKAIAGNKTNAVKPVQSRSSGVAPKSLHDRIVSMLS